MTKLKSKRLLSLLLSLAMVFSLTVTPVYAASDDGTDDAVIVQSTSSDDAESEETTDEEDASSDSDGEEETEEDASLESDEEEETEEDTPTVVSEESETGTTNVATIDSTGYSSLEEAISAAKSSNETFVTITLTSDVTTSATIEWSQASPSLTINLNGYSITKTLDSTSGNVFDVFQGTFTLTGSGTVTNNNGNSAVRIKGSTDSTASNYTVVTVDQNVTLVAGYPMFVTPNSQHGYGVVVNINGTLNASTCGFYVNGQMQDTTGNVPTVNIGSTAKITSTASGSGDDMAGIYLAGYAKTTVAAGAEITGCTGIEIRAGELTVNGGTITGTGNFTIAENGNGTTSSGIGIAVVQHTTNLPVSVTVNGGTISGVYAVYENDIEDDTSTGSISISLVGGSYTGTNASVTITDSTEVTIAITGGTYLISSGGTTLADTTALSALGITLNSDGSVTTATSSTVWDGTIATGFASGSGTSTDPYIIANGAQLAYLAQQVNAGTTYNGSYFQLSADIDLNNIQWTPIGNTTYSFQGYFDGANYIISNLYAVYDLSSSSSNKLSNVGLFGYTTSGSVSNFTITNATVSGRLNVGVVAGCPYTSTYSNITVNGNIYVTGYAYVGGAFGKNAYANITNVDVIGNTGSYVKAESENYRTYVGGLIGFMGEGNVTVSYCDVEIDVSGSTCDVGGLLGILHYGNTLSNCTYKGTVTVTDPDTDNGDEIGGLVGTVMNRTSDNSIINCTFTGSVYSGENDITSTASAYGAYYYDDFDTSSSYTFTGTLVTYNGTDVSVTVSSSSLVAMIGSTYYTSLADAVSAANEAGTATTVTLLQDITIENATYNGSGLYQASGDITLDLSEHSLIVDTTRVFGVLDGGSLTVKNGTVKIADGAIGTGNQFNILRGTCSFTAENVTFDSNNIAANFLHVAADGTATISLTNCDITNQSGGVVVYDNDGNSKVTLTGCNYATNPSGGALNTITNFKIVFNSNNQITSSSTNWEASNSLRYTYVVTDGGSVEANLTLATTKGAASLTVEGGNVTGTVNVVDGTSMTVSGGTVTGTVINYGTFTMTGGTVTASDSASQAVLVKGGTVNISDGIISASSSRALVFDTSVTVSGTISGGTFIGNDIALLARSSENNKVSVIGGTYTASKGIDLVADILATGYSVYDTDGKAATVSGNYYMYSLDDNTVVVDIAVDSRVASVTIGETTTYYSSLSAAVEAANAATEATTITLLSDVEIDDGQIVFDNSSAAITLELNGKIISRGGSAYYALTVVYSGTTLTVQDSSEEATGKIDATFTESTSTTSYAIWNEGTLNITGGTFAGRCAIYGTTGTVNISDGTISGAYIGVMASGSMDVNISGGTIIDSSHSGVYMSSTGTLKITGGTISSKYSVNVLNGTLEIDGENVSIGGTYGVWCQGSSVVATIKSGKIAGETGGVMAFSGANVTIGTEGSETGPEISGSYEAVEISTSSTATAPAIVTVYSGTLSGTSYGICIYGKNSDYYSQLYVYGGSISATTYFAITGNGSTGQGYTIIYIYGGEITSTNGQAIYHPQQDGTMYVYGGTIKGDTGIEVRGGTVVIEDKTSNSSLTIEATGTPTTSDPNYSGSTTSGAAIAVAPYNLSDVNVSIVSGTLTGVTAVTVVNPNSVEEWNYTTVVAISGGTLTGAITEEIEDTLQISGGTYSTAVTIDQCADGYYPIANSDSTYTVTQLKLGYYTSTGSETDVVTATSIDGYGESVMYVGVSADDIKNNYSTSKYPTNPLEFTDDDDETHSYIFAGWYSAADSNSAMESFPSGAAYAKFVDADVLTVKCVVSTVDSATRWRFMTSLDTLYYTAVGFTVTDSSLNSEVTLSKTSIWKNSLTVTSVDPEIKTLATDFSSASTRVATAYFDVTNNATSDTYTVTPYWTTGDGTTVTGRTVSFTYTGTVGALTADETATEVAE